MIEKRVRTCLPHLVILSFLMCVALLSAAGQDPSLQVRTKSGRTEFRVGEVILLDLIFAANTSDTYGLIAGGEFPDRYPLRDTFQVQPDRGWEDPLGDYRVALFKAETIGHFPIARSFMTSNIVLSPKPYALPSVVLNDYVRFSRPGVYTVQVQDSRVTSITKRMGTPSERLTLASNRLELTILPADAKWQQDQLHEAVASLTRLRQAIDSGARSYQSSLADSCITLRTLGTNEAGTAMVDALRDDALFSICSFQAGIWEFPDRRFILEQMRALLKDPEVPISYTFFSTMATVSVLADKHPDQLFTGKPRKIDQQLEQQILASLPSKQGQAKIGTINTLVGISFAKYGGNMGDLVRAPKKLAGLDSRVLQVATENVGQLSPSAQSTLRNYRQAQNRN
jgi:hypothetical protein